MIRKPIEILEYELIEKHIIIPETQLNIRIQQLITMKLRCHIRVDRGDGRRNQSSLYFRVSLPRVSQQRLYPLDFVVEY